MQSTTMTDINEMNKNMSTTPIATDNEPDSLSEATTAPQEQLDKLGEATPKQPIGNNQNK